VRHSAPTWTEVLTSWGPTAVVTAAVLAGTVGYLWLGGRIRRDGPGGWPARRVGCWLLAMAVLVVAVDGPVGRYAEVLFWVHMVQHLLIGDLAAFCIVKGLSGAVLRPLLALPAVWRLRFLAHPLVALPVWALNLYVWHLPVLYEAALEHSGLHALEHAMFFATGALMWAAVIEPLPGVRWFGTGWKAAYVLAVRAVGAGLANVFIWSDQPLYPWYGTDLSDQMIGGLIMFTEGGIVTLLAFAWLFLGWMKEAETSGAS
jgi:putative membrane protein